jgi:UDP-GlcNAc:undecaprenyl-phosphate GlcNAc-1-phosphate transferase
MEPNTTPLNPLRDEFGVTDPSQIDEAVRDLAQSADQAASSIAHGELDIFHGYMGVFVVAFLVTLLITPVMRRLAVANGVIDRPDDPRKVHKLPVAYLGGAAVFLGMLAGIAFSYFASDPLLTEHESSWVMLPVPGAVILGMTVIMLTGLIDDIVGISPRIKIAGQLFAAAALALNNVGVEVAKGFLVPIGAAFGRTDLTYHIMIPDMIPLFAGEVITVDIIYWTGTAIIAIFILGACNASNLIDGLDGLLSGVTSIAAVGLLILALGMALADDGALDSARIVMCLCLLGACLGFLPHNFRPATIFLGDAGSLLIGYMTIVIILTLGNTGKTPLVVAGLIIYSLPIIDTTLAIVRRKMSGRSISDADDQHLHHMLKRSLGVTKAVFTMYAIAASFAVLGILVSVGRARVAYTVALVFASFIGVTAIKMARRAAIEAESETALQRAATRRVARATNGVAAGTTTEAPATPAP